MKIDEFIESFELEERKLFLSMLDAGAWGAARYQHNMMRCCFALHDADSLTIDALIRQLFPSEDPEEKSNYMRSQLSILTGYIKKYFAYDIMLSDEHLAPQLYTRALRQRKLAEYSQRYGKQEASKLKKIETKGPGEFLALFHLLEESRITSEQLEQPGELALLQGSLEALDKVYIIKKLSLAYQANSLSWGAKQRHTLSFFPLIEEMAASESFADDPLIQLYLQLAYLTYELSPKNNRYYFKAKELFLALLPALSAWSDTLEAKRIFSYLTNYCIININLKNMAFTQEYIVLHEHVLGKGLIEDREGKIDPYEFKNIFTVFLRYIGLEHAQHFLDRYGKKVNGDKTSTEAMEYFSLAQIAYARKQYDEAFTQAQRALGRLNAHSSYQLTLEVKAFAIRMAYKLGDRIYTETQSKGLIRLKARKNGIEQQKQNSFKNFADKQLKLCRIAFSKRGNKAEQLTRFLDELKHEQKAYYAKNWLINEVRGRIEALKD